MPRVMDLNKCMDAVCEVAQTVKATWIDVLPEVNAVLTVRNAAKDSLAFRIQDEQITMYFSAGGRFYAADAMSASVKGTPEDAVRMLLQYAGCLISDTGHVSVSATRGSQTRPLMELTNQGLVIYALENAWEFGNFTELMDYVNDKYRTLSWRAWEGDLQ